MVYLPPDKITESPDVFLAGPIQGAWNWQDKAIELFGDKYLIADPRRDNFIDEQFEEQVLWETEALEKSKNILFWLAKEKEHSCNRIYAKTTRFELGEWLAKASLENNKTHKIHIGIEKGFVGWDYIEVRLKLNYPEVYVAHSLEELVNHIKEQR